MSQVPPNFNSKTSFSTLAQQPITRAGLPGGQLDAEFSRVSDSVNATIERLGIIQRDDGELQSSSVGIEQLGEQALALLSAGGAKIRGKWAPSTQYNVGDFVSVASPAFLVSGITSPVEANGRYFLVGNSDGDPIFSKEGGYDHILVAGRVSAGSPNTSGPYPKRYILNSTKLNSLIGVECSGPSIGGFGGFYFRSEIVSEGRLSYQQKNPILGQPELYLYYDNGRWKCGNRNLQVYYQSVLTSAQTPENLQWSPVLGTGNFYATSSIQPPPAGSYQTIFLRTDAGLPWEAPTSWYNVQGAGAISIARFSGSSGLANSSYIAIAEHVSSSVFEDDVFLWGLIASPKATNNLRVDSFIGDGIKKTFVLSVGAANVNNTQVFINGVYQSKSKYLLDGDAISFTDAAGAPMAGAAIEAVCGIATEVNITNISEGVVKTSSVQSYAITERTLSNDSVSARTLQLNSVGTGNIIAGSITTPLLALGCVNSDHISADSINSSMIVNGSITKNELSVSSVGSAQIDNGCINSGKLAAGPLGLNGEYWPTQPNELVSKSYFERVNSIGSSMLQPNSVTSDKYALGSISPNRFTQGSNTPLKVFQSVKTSGQNTTGGTWVTVTGLIAALPRYTSSSKVRIQAMIGCSSSSGYPVLFRVIRNGGFKVCPPNAGARRETVACGGVVNSDFGIDCVCIDVIDDLVSVPDQIVTYEIQFDINPGSTAYINRSRIDTDAYSVARTSSTMTLTELS